MVKHYVYRMDHDEGFAPHVGYGICTLCGCKEVMERCSEIGSWIIGIGGNETGQPNKLIYAMKVERKLSLRVFRKEYPGVSRYLMLFSQDRPVLLSRKFYYFGRNAICLPRALRHIVIDRWGFWTVSEKDIELLKKYLERRYPCGRLGEPCNPS